MPKVVVNHTGSCNDKQGNTHTFVEGEPKDLPQDVVDALGENASAPQDAVKAEKEAKKKEVKDKEDRQVKSDEIVTK